MKHDLSYSQIEMLLENSHSFRTQIANKLVSLSENTFPFDAVDRAAIEAVKYGREKNNNKIYAIKHLRTWSGENFSLVPSCYADSYGYSHMSLASSKYLIEKFWDFKAE